MGYIGKVIRVIRKKENISRARLTEGICTEKYLYLIERGARNPSAEMLILLSGRLGADLLKYYEYLDCHDPVTICDVVEQFNMFRRTSDFKGLRRLNDEMKQQQDFLRTPLCYEIKVNELSCMMFLDDRYEEAAHAARNTLDKMDARYAQSEFTANLYLIVSTAMQHQNRLEEAGKASREALAIVTNKESILRYRQVVVSARLNHMTLAHLMGDPDTVIREGLWVNEYSIRNNLHERSGFHCFFLALGYWAKNDRAQARRWMESCLFDLLIHPNSLTVKYITGFGPFQELLRNCNVCPDLMGRLRDRYDVFRRMEARVS